MITLQELSNYLDEYLKVSEFSDYCPNGVQIEGKQEIKKIGVAVSASLETLLKCIEAKVDVLIVHHGLFWSGNPLPIVGSKQKKIKLLLEHTISLLAYHLPLDAHREVGNNWTAAKKLGWENLEPFDVGVQGTFPEMSVEEFTLKLENYYCHPATVAKSSKQSIASAALISGGAYKYLEKAKHLDAFITGNFDEPAWWIAKEEETHFFAMGHFATERIGPQALGDHLSQKFNIPTQFIDCYNPF